MPCHAVAVQRYEMHTWGAYSFHACIQYSTCTVYLGDRIGIRKAHAGHRSVPIVSRRIPFDTVHPFTGKNRRGLDTTQEVRSMITNKEVVFSRMGGMTIQSDTHSYGLDRGFPLLSSSSPRQTHRSCFSLCLCLCLSLAGLAGLSSEKRAIKQWQWLFW